MVSAKNIKDGIAELIIACEVIRDYKACLSCPMLEHCLEECTFEHIAYIAKTNDIQAMLNKAETITEIIEEKSKAERDRRWEAEADYWNDRRCDPDDE